jgi:aspartate kinase
VHTKAKIREITPVRVLQALDEGSIVLVAGFQGFSRDTMDVTTLGRGGTDATAVALAASLGGTCEIYTAVPGVFTADPTIVPEARRLDRVSYAEMLELAASGASVVETRALEIARSHGVPIHARSMLSGEAGTWITASEEERPVVTVATTDETEVLFTLSGIPDGPGQISDLFATVAAEHVSVGMILQHAKHAAAELSFTVPEEDAAATRRAVEKTQERLAAMSVLENRALGKVSVIGAGMGLQPGVAARVFGALAAEHIDVEVISTSHISISCMIARAQVERAVRALHDAFELERSPGEGLRHDLL